MLALSQTARSELLRIARDALKKKLKRGSVSPAATRSRELEVTAGAFVTLRKGGELRGCIGTFQAEEPLWRVVAAMAVAAGFKDPRFPPLTARELPELGIEISVLSPLRAIADPREVEVGRHGLQINKEGLQGVLLPQVATEHGWDRETFLDHVCQKAGLPANAWRHGARLQVFEAEIFSEHPDDGQGAGT